MNSLIIPAAGRGTRLGADMPKVLFPVGGKPMIDYLVQRYQSVVDHFVVVIHPSANAEVRQALERHNIRFDIRYQHEATGMLDAILLAGDAIQSRSAKNVWITWCDQIGISEATVKRLKENLQSLSPTEGLVFPTARVKQPYIHFDRDDDGKIRRVLQRREGAVMPDIGENDCGLFAMTRSVYLDILPEFARQSGLGDGTGERNFLPFIPWFANRGKVVTFAVNNPIEAVGVNTREDADQILRYLESIH